MSGRYIRRSIEPAKAGALLDQVMAIGGGEEPRNVTGWFQDGALRRVRADYPNGWRLQFSVSPRGVVSRARASLTLKVGAPVQ